MTGITFPRGRGCWGAGSSSAGAAAHSNSHRLMERERSALRFIDSSLPPDSPGVMSHAMSRAPFWAASPTCRACGRHSVAGSYLCVRCRAVMARVEIRKNANGRGRPVDKQASAPPCAAALVRPTDRQLPLFLHGVPLELAAGTWRSAEWTHLPAGDESSVVLACRLVNRTQTDLTEDEFEMPVKAWPAASTVSRSTRRPYQLNPSSERGLGRQARESAARGSRVDWVPAPLQRQARYRLSEPGPSVKSRR